MPPCFIKIKIFLCENIVYPYTTNIVIGLNYFCFCFFVRKVNFLESKMKNIIEQKMKKPRWACLPPCT